jgi:hypothetical protein
LKRPAIVAGNGSRVVSSPSVAYQHHDVGECAGRIAFDPVIFEALVRAPDVDRLQQPGRAAHRIAQLLDRRAVEPARGVRPCIEDLQRNESIAMFL